MDRLVDSEEKQKTCKTEKVNIMKKLLVISVLLLSAVFLTRAQSQKILFVMSAEDTLLLNKGKKERQTGVFLNEFYLAYKAIIKEGYMVDFATPGGLKATVDLESLDEKYWEEKPGLKDEALEFWNKDEKFAKPITLEKAIKNYNKLHWNCNTGWSRFNGRSNLRYQYTGITKNFCRKSKSCRINMSRPCANYNHPRRSKSVYWLQGKFGFPNRRNIYRKTYNEGQTEEQNDSQTT
jgi:hypothetical protein